MPIYEVDDLNEEKQAADAAAEGTQTIIEPSPEAALDSAPAKAAKPSKHETADELTAAFWERHQTNLAQSFLAVRGVIRTAIANGNARNDVAHALDRLAKEQRAISGGTLQTALGQIRGAVGRTNGHQPYRNNPTQSIGAGFPGYPAHEGA